MCYFLLILGLIIGGTLGVLVMAMFQINKGRG